MAMSGFCGYVGHRYNLYLALDKVCLSLKALSASRLSKIEGFPEQIRMRVTKKQIKDLKIRGNLFDEDNVNESDRDKAERLYNSLVADQEDGVDSQKAISICEELYPGLRENSQAQDGVTALDDNEELVLLLDAKDAMKFPAKSVFSSTSVMEFMDRIANDKDDSQKLEDVIKSITLSENVAEAVKLKVNQSDFKCLMTSLVENIGEEVANRLGFEERFAIPSKISFKKLNSKRDGVSDDNEEGDLGAKEKLKHNIKKAMYFIYNVCVFLLLIAFVFAKSIRKISVTVNNELIEGQLEEVNKMLLAYDKYQNYYKASDVLLGKDKVFNDQVDAYANKCLSIISDGLIVKDDEVPADFMVNDLVGLNKYIHAREEENKRCHEGIIDIDKEKEIYRKNEYAKYIKEGLSMLSTMLLSRHKISEERVARSYDGMLLDQGAKYLAAAMSVESVDKAIYGKFLNASASSKEKLSYALTYMKSKGFDIEKILSDGRDRVQGMPIDQEVEDAISQSNKILFDREKKIEPHYRALLDCKECLEGFLSVDQELVKSLESMGFKDRLVHNMKIRDLHVENINPSNSSEVSSKLSGCVSESVKSLNKPDLGDKQKGGSVEDGFAKK